MIQVLLAVFLGGGLGSAARYAVSLMINERAWALNFPWPTLIVNVAGSFLIGLFYALSEKLDMSDEMRLFLTAGLCGGFTTFSAFSNDSIVMLRNGEFFICLIYIGLSILLGILSCMLGYWTCHCR